MFWRFTKRNAGIKGKKGYLVVYMCTCIKGDVMGEKSFGFYFVFLGAFDFWGR